MCLTQATVTQCLIHPNRTSVSEHILNNNNSRTATYNLYNTTWWYCNNWLPDPNTASFQQYSIHIGPLTSFPRNTLRSGCHIARTLRTCGYEIWWWFILDGIVSRAIRWSEQQPARLNYISWNLDCFMHWTQLRGLICAISTVKKNGWKMIRRGIRLLLRWSGTMARQFYSWLFLMFTIYFTVATWSTQLMQWYVLSPW